MRIFHKECIDLVAAGYDVSLVGRSDIKRVLNSVRIIPIRKTHGRLTRAVFASRNIYHQAVKLNADIYHIHDPELIPVGILLRIRGKKVIYDAHEDLPEQIFHKLWIPLFLRGFFSKTATLVLRISGLVFFSGIVAATPTIEKKFPSSKTVLVCNFPILEEFDTCQKMPFADRPYGLAYIGGISEIRGIREIVKSLELLSDQDVCLQLAGNFESDELEIEVTQQKGWDKVDYRGWLDREQVGNLLCGVRAGLVLLHPAKNYIDAFPVKMFEYMAAGIPVIASNFPLWKEIVEGEECGLCVDPLKPEEIAEAIQWLFDHPEEAETIGLNGRKAVEEKYNWESESKKLLSLYEEVLSN